MSNTFFNNFKTVVLLGALTGLILFIGSFWGQQGLIVALIFAGISNFVALFFSDRIALATMRAQEVGPDHELYQIVQRLAARANLPMPRVYISPHPAPNAFATGRNPRNAAVCATAGLLQMLNRDEITGVMAHELAHIKHRDTLIQSVAATIGGAISMLGYMFMFGGGRGRDGETGHPIAALLVLLLGPLAAGLIQMAISRAREYNADTAGAEFVGDPLPLAAALEKLHLASRRVPLAINPAFNEMFIIEPLNPMRSVANLFATHPPVEKRIMNLIGRESTGMFRYAA